MKNFLACLILLPASIGCTMCAHPFDYNYAAYDINQSMGHRAGSAFAPQSETASSESVLETVELETIDLSPPETMVIEEIAEKEGTLSR